MSRRTRILGAVAGGLCPLAAVVAQQPPPVRETVEVVELSALAEVPLRRGLLGWNLVGPEDIELYEDGARREVTHLEGSPQAGSWRVLVWIDGERCSEASLRASLEALAASQSELEALGPAEVVIADPVPRLLGPTRGAAGWRALATDVGRSIACRDAPRAASDRLRDAGRPAAALAAGLRGEIERNDALLLYAGSATAGGPAALILVAEGYDLRPQLRWAENQRPSGALQFEARSVSATEELGRGLAEGGWTVVIPALPPPRQRGESQAIGGSVPPGPSSPLPPTLRVWPPRTRGQIRRPEAYEVYLDFRLEPWRRVAVMTAGAVAGSAEDLTRALSGVAGLRRVWYRSSRPAPGEARPLELLLRRSDARRLRAPVRLPTRFASDTLAAARSRAAMSAGGGEGDLPWTVRRVGDGYELALRPGDARRWLRIGVVAPATADSAWPRAELERVELTAQVPLRLPEAPAGGALYVEDLSSGAWWSTPSFAR